MLDLSVNSCRICLKGPTSVNDNWESQVKSMEENDENSAFSYMEKFTMCTGISIDLDCQYAKKICSTCSKNLQDSFNFLVTAKKTEIILQNYLNDYIHKETPPPTKILFEMPDLNNVATKMIANELTFNDPNKNIEFLSVHKVEGHLSDEKHHSNNDDNDDNIENTKNETDETIYDNNKIPNRKYKLKKHKNKDEVTDNLIKTKLHHKKPVKFKKPPKIKEPETPIICDICGNFYKDRKQLEFHRHLHTGEKNFKCSICDRGFALRSYLTGHMLTHTGIRKFQCNFCDKKFYRACVMRLHEKKHTLQREFECQICNKKFKLANYLKRHMRIHNDERPYNCKLCGVSFRRDHHLKQHIRTRGHRELMSKKPLEQIQQQSESNIQSTTNYENNMEN